MRGGGLKRGAAALVSEEFLPVPEEIPLIRVENARKALARISAAVVWLSGQEADLGGRDGNQGKNYHRLDGAGDPGAGRVQNRIAGNCFLHYGGKESFILKIPRRNPG